MRMVRILVVVGSLAASALAQELGPLNRVIQPVASPVNLSQSIAQQPTAYQPSLSLSTPSQPSTTQPIPSSLTVPMSQMPTQPQTSQPVAQICGCGLAH